MGASPRNPFIPTFGVSPSVFAGRNSVVESFGRGLEGGVGDPRRALLLSGPRGIGKTVTLNELEDEAKRRGWVVLRAQPHNLVQLLVDTAIPHALSALSQQPEGRRRITGVNIAGIGGVRSEIDDGHDPAPSLITGLNSLADEAGAESGILITVDEVQSAPSDQLWELTAAVQDLMRDNRNIAFAAAGLPEGIATLLQHPGTTFLRRAQHSNLGPMSPEQTAEVLSQTAEAGGALFDNEALRQAVGMSRGYPFLIQLIGFHLFERAGNGGTIAAGDVEAVRDDVLGTLGQLVHAPALSGVPPKQEEFLVAMANVQEDLAAVPTAAIARELGAAPQSLTMARQALLRRELVYSPKHGYLNFTIPHMGHHLLGRGLRDSGWD
ncbi:AAA ATPase domain-containing protein [Corynebacterium appendicis CIP 107643]|uniref:AAA ATPase domain-containing protein n=1 Tax=Corynebacterium appendicis CIP 107643 TaxID=1161099 RepID=A0A1N7JBV0_9CORY|nr:ATP-binding protein [Corynebacterium appendicis]WJY60375.1 hypothetical protein CAPP_02160 [Corynebacterium appendicis CIP 107643]SIS46741.1 AAA ATPase domain-containing protein [Corynebacterium appendicis CIP 107643]